MNLVPIANLSSLLMDSFMWHNAGASTLLKDLESCFVSSGAFKIEMNRGKTVMRRW